MTKISNKELEMHSPWLDVYCQVDRKIYKLDSYWISLQLVRRKLCLVENIDSNLRLITSGDRNAAGIFTIPDKPEDIIDNIDEKYSLWYFVWNEYCHVR